LWEGVWKERELEKRGERERVNGEREREGEMFAKLFPLFFTALWLMVDQ
jgi:hypothetical protein